MAQRTFVPRHKIGAPGRTFDHRQAWKNMYDGAWESYRLKFLKHNPFCYACGKPAQVVDHLEPHQGDERLFKKLDNHIPLCTTHHNTVTSAFDRKHRPGMSIQPKMRWLNDMRLKFGITIRVKKMPSYDG